MSGEYGCGGTASEMEAGEARYISDNCIGCVNVSGWMYGKYVVASFSNLDNYFNFLTDFAGLPENKRYAAYWLDCQHSATPCVGGEKLLSRTEGVTTNYRIQGFALDPNSMGGMIRDPSFFSNMVHGGPSWYTRGILDAGHVATYQSDVESHFDLFNGVLAFPLHFLFDYLPSLFINTHPGVTVPTYTCSPIGGCN